VLVVVGIEDTSPRQYNSFLGVPQQVVNAEMELEVSSMGADKLWEHPSMWWLPYGVLLAFAIGPPHFTVEPQAFNDHSGSESYS
jgi:hypothetical protein